MIRRWCALLVTSSVVSSVPSFAQVEPGGTAPIIDMHLHALPATWPAGRPAPNPVTGKTSAATTDEAIMRATLDALRRYNIVKAVTSGPLDYVDKWRAEAADRIIAAPLFPSMVGDVTGYTTPFYPDIAMLRRRHAEGRLGAIGEVTAQYAGLAPDDSALEPYFALAEELDIPVGFHTGTSFSRTPYTCCPRFRLRFGNPLLLEDVLVKHPKLRLYIMHGGEPWRTETIALMRMYPQVYADLAVIDWIVPRQRFHDYLKVMIAAGFGKRLMFGSDQMAWPEAIGMAIEGVESADFLSEEQKRDIFYNNAARFLRLAPLSGAMTQ